MMGLRLEKLDECRWQIPRGGGMRVPGTIYASEPLMEAIRDDRSPEQVANVAHLPGIVSASIAMPDIHWGYGFPIGGVAAFDPDEGGVVSPGGVGYDINCGVRLLRSNLDRRDLEGRVAEIAQALYRRIPCGVGSQSDLRLSARDLDHVLRRGAGWAVEKGLGRDADLEVIEEGGCFGGAEPGQVSERAKERGRPQLGTLGSGNHFAELGYVAEVLEPQVAAVYGLEVGRVTLLIHSGSRGLGHQVCDDFLRVMIEASRRYRIDLPDRQLCAAPLGSPEARAYLSAMAAAVNFAFANRQVMTHQARQALAGVFGTSDEALGLELVYDVCHNVAKWEDHEVDGQRRRLCVHRKGATRAFGPGHPHVPARYRAVGQPVLVPGDMGRHSFVLAGTEQAMKETFGSSCHGAGRRLSRKAARKAARGRQLFEEMAARGVIVQAQNVATVAEEIPEAYKDVADVVDVLDRAGVTRKVARLVPLAVVKG